MHFPPIHTGGRGALCAPYPFRVKENVPPRVRQNFKNKEKEEYLISLENGKKIRDKDVIQFEMTGCENSENLFGIKQSFPTPIISLS